MDILNAKKIGIAALLFASFSPQANTVMDFNFTNENMSVEQNGFKYYEKGTTCNYNGALQGKLCSSDGARIYTYYSPYTSEHMGYMRYGSLYLDSSRSVEGGALGITLTGGRYHDDDGELQESGADIRDMFDYKDALERQDADLYSNEQDLPGWTSIFYSNSTTTTKIEALNGANRFNVWVWYPSSPNKYASYSRDAKDATTPKKTLSWYPFLDDSRGNHYYHHATNRGYGGWIKASFDAHPTHNNAISGDVNYGFSAGGVDSPGDSVGYFNRIVSFALVFDETKETPSPYTFSTDSWTTELKEYENEETIANLAIGYDPYYRKFDVSFEDKYRCGTCNAEYKLTYSFEPITNDNIDETSEVLTLTNFFLEDDNDEKIIYKPHAGYNQVWAGFSISQNDLTRFHNGEEIYFAVVDKTVREHETEAIDDETVTLPSGKVIKNKDLVKTISYEYHGNNYESRIEGESELSTSVNVPSTKSFPLVGLSSSYVYTVVADEGIEASVVYNNSNANLTVNSTQIGEYDLAIEARNTQGKLIARKSIKVYIDPYDCRAMEECTKETLVNFHHSNDASTRPNPLWQDIFSDGYTGYSNGGIGIVVGANGSYNYQGIKGEPLTFGPLDVIQFSLLNISDVEITAIPAISSTTTSKRLDETDWLDLRAQKIEAGERRYWNVPISEFADSTLSSININLANMTQRLRIEEISVISEGEGFCTSCSNVLVDFYPQPGVNVTPVDGWDTILMDRYTGDIYGGAGIVVGSNPDYDYKGVKGTSFSPNTLTLEWFNTSKNAYTFSPRVSFDDDDRPSSGVSGTWTTLAPVYLPAYSRATSTVEVDGSITMINTNVNILQSGTIGLDRITYE